MRQAPKPAKAGLNQNHTSIMNHLFNSDPYGEVICRWFTQHSPASISRSKECTLEILSSLLIGTKENRYGPIPVPEHLVVIRETIRKSIAMNLPIPILVPWGGIKGNMEDQTLDIAEVSAIFQLLHLDKTIREIYEPGLLINVRIEDLGAEWLYRELSVSRKIINYSLSMERLIDKIKGETAITGISESTLMLPGDYFSSSMVYSNLLFDMINQQIEKPERDVNDIDAYCTLVEMGWKGTVPIIQREYYISRYRNLYPDKTEKDYIRMLADYLGGAKARYDLNGRAEPTSEVGSYIQITFVPPVPGAPSSIFNNTLYWRSVPMSQSRSHIAPWRAKGYLKIGEETVKGKITNFGDPVLQELVPSTTTIRTGNSQQDFVKISTDYVIE